MHSEQKQRIKCSRERGVITLCNKKVMVHIKAEYFTIILKLRIPVAVGMTIPPQENIISTILKMAKMTDILQRILAKHNSLEKHIFVLVSFHRILP